jgi:hypothetical protein
MKTREMRALTEIETEALEEGLNLAALLAEADRPLQSDQLEALYNLIRGADVRSPAHIIALGLAFGEELMGHGDFEWVRVIDDFGEETCIAIRGFSINCYPISMIEKRLDRGELLDFVDLRKETIAVMEDMVDEKIERRDR